MKNLLRVVPVMAAVLLAAPAAAQREGAILGPYAARCAAGNAPSILSLIHI